MKRWYCLMLFVFLIRFSYGQIIDSFPYFENFDDVFQYPNLPAGWIKLIDGAGDIWIEAADSFSPRFHVWMIGYQASSLMLISPVIQDISEKRIRFWAKSRMSLLTLEVGTISDHSNAGTFQIMETFSLNNQYKLFTIYLSEAIGDRVAFRCHLTLNFDYNAILIDNVMIDIPSERADFYCHTFSLNFGEILMHQSSEATVKMYNHGTEPLYLTHSLPYEVSADNTFYSINPGEDIEIAYVFIPESEGFFIENIAIFTNATNFPTHEISLSAFVFPSPPENTVQIGSGSTSYGNYPWAIFTGADYYTQTLYHANEINRADGEYITSIFYDFNAYSVISQDIQVYLGHTDIDAYEYLVREWISLDNMTMVFDGQVTTTAFPFYERNWLEIELHTPFPYDGVSNLVIAINKTGLAFTGLNYFYGTVIDDLRAVSTIFNPYNSSTSYMAKSDRYLPNTRLTFSPSPPKESALILLSHNVLNFGWIFQNDTSTRNMTIHSIGTETLEIEIDIPDFIFTNVSGKIYIAAGESQEIEFTLKTPNAGLFSDTVMITSNAVNFPIRNMTMTAQIVELPPKGYIQIGTENHESAFPWSSNYIISSNSYKQMIYHANEINLPAETIIKSIAFNNTRRGGMEERIIVYIGHTMYDEFMTNQSWIPIDHLTLVFEGNVFIPLDANKWLEIEMDDHFVYDGSSNLVIAVLKYLNIDENVSNPYFFYATRADKDRSIAFSDRSSIPDIQNLPDGFRYSSFPNVRLGYDDNVPIDDKNVSHMTNQLYSNFPNPFNPETKIRFNLSNDSHVLIEIYNIRGQKVKTLVNEDMTAGHHQTIWNGLNDYNQRVASGLYLCRLQAGGEQMVRKMVLLK